MERRGLSPSVSGSRDVRTKDALAIGSRPDRCRPSAPARGTVLDHDRYVAALFTFVANNLLRSATATYQRRFGVNVTAWRIMSLLAIEPDIPAWRICRVIGFDKGPVSRTLAERSLVSVHPAPKDRRSHIIALTSDGRTKHDEIIVVALERERRLLDCLTRASRIR